MLSNLAPLVEVDVHVDLPKGLPELTIPAVTPTSSPTPSPTSSMVSNSPVSKSGSFLSAAKSPLPEVRVLEAEKKEASPLQEVILLIEKTTAEHLVTKSLMEQQEAYTQVVGYPKKLDEQNKQVLGAEIGLASAESEHKDAIEKYKNIKKDLDTLTQIKINLLNAMSEASATYLNHPKHKPGTHKERFGWIHNANIQEYAETHSLENIHSDITKILKHGTTTKSAECIKNALAKVLDELEKLLPKHYVINHYKKISKSLYDTGLGFSQKNETFSLPKHRPLDCYPILGSLAVQFEEDLATQQKSLTQLSAAKQKVEKTSLGYSKAQQNLTTQKKSLETLIEEAKTSCNKLEITLQNLSQKSREKIENNLLDAKNMSNSVENAKNNLVTEFENYKNLPLSEKAAAAKDLKLKQEELSSKIPKDYLKNFEAWQQAIDTDTILAESNKKAYQAKLDVEKKKCIEAKNYLDFIETLRLASDFAAQAKVVSDALEAAYLAMTDSNPNPDEEKKFPQDKLTELNRKKENYDNAVKALSSVAHSKPKFEEYVKEAKKLDEKFVQEIQDYGKKFDLAVDPAIAKYARSIEVAHVEKIFLKKKQALEAEIQKQPKPLPPSAPYQRQVVVAQVVDKKGEVSPRNKELKQVFENCKKLITDPEFLKLWKSKLNYGGGVEVGNPPIKVPKGIAKIYEIFENEISQIANLGFNQIGFFLKKIGEKSEKRIKAGPTRFCFFTVRDDFTTEVYKILKKGTELSLKDFTQLNSYLPQDLQFKDSEEEKLTPSEAKAHAPGARR